MKTQKPDPKAAKSKPARMALCIPESTEIAMMRFILDRRLKGERWSKTDIMLRGVDLFFERAGEGEIVK
ncbi:hypothetical protein WNY59_09580 [Ahrensia kielensis]|uniref:Uncharacterized protein n=1 Tax=Ahrensia kielensis TaxID=76980 RepID=A0ABU9T7T0_9HYPH